MVVLAEEPAKEGDLVVAVDFGTSRSAVAYTQVGYDDELVNVLKLSGAASYVHGDFKTPTSILIDKGNVRAFGFEAEEIFAAEQRRSNWGWMLFKWLKMKLHRPFESDPLVACFGGGAHMRLSEVLQKCLEYVKADVLRQLKLKGLVRSEDTTLFWVLTLPAIWSDNAKYVMRKAAYEAGLVDSEQSCRLLLALEPECAAIASRADPLLQKLWDLGTEFLIADCGGGTLDITSYEVLQSSPLKLKELTQPVGGPFGATQVDKKFIEFFKRFVGKKNFHRLLQQKPAKYLSLVKEWEEKKVTFRFDRRNNEWTKLHVVNALVGIGVEAEFGSMIDAWNERNPSKAVETLARDRIKLSLSFNLMVSFFEDVVSEIVDRIDNALRTCSGVDKIVITGGFAKCVLLQEKVRERFAPTSVDVIVANDPDLLIVKGAAVFGASPIGVVASRKSHYTFGVAARIEYNGSDAVHRRYKDKVYANSVGKDSLDIFSVHGRVGDDLDESDPTRRQSYKPSCPEQDTCKFRILVTEERHVFHTKEEGVETLGSVSIPFDMNLDYEDRMVWFEFLFGGTEVRCLVYDAAGEKEIGSVPIQFNFSK